METNQDNVVPAIVKVDIVNKIGPEGRESNSTMKVEGGLAEVQQQLDLAALSRGDARRAEGQWPGKFGWVAWVVAGVLAAGLITFLILFLVKGNSDETKTANPPQPAAHDQLLASTSDAVDEVARSGAREAGLTADNAKEVADTAFTAANTAMDESQFARDEAAEAKTLA